MKKQTNGLELDHLLMKSRHIFAQTDSLCALPYGYHDSSSVSLDVDPKRPENTKRRLSCLPRRLFVVRYLELLIQFSL